MLLKILIKYIFGYLRVSIEGYYIERFVNVCSNKKIIIWNLKKENGVKLFLNIGIKDFIKIKSIARKTKCKIKIENRKGLPFVVNKYKKRKLFLILLILVCIIIYSSSNYVWNIEIQVEDGKEIKNLIEDLENCGLKVGMLKKNVNTKEIINLLRLNRDDLSWVGINVNGTNAIVKIVKADKAPEVIDESEFSNIVSNKNGIITKIVAQNGTANVSVGDTVSIGTVLISGTMEGKYTGVRYVHSLGNIEAKVWYTKTEKINFKQEENIKTGNKEEKYRIKLNNFQINLYKTLSNFQIYDTIEEEKKFKIFSNLYLPISLIKVENDEVKQQTKIYTIEDAIQIGKERLEESIENEIENLDNILR